MPSFEKINYALRPNKSVERKLVVERLKSLAGVFDWSQYRYLGMGSMWYVDFRLMHRNFQMKEMISIERDALDRAEFNRPFDCVTVVEGDTTPILDAFDFANEPAVVWLDHDSNLTGPVLDDVTVLAGKLPTNSVAIFTVNAHVGQIRGVKTPSGGEMTEEEALRYYAGDLAPFPVEKGRLSRREFPGVVSETVLNGWTHALKKAGRDCEFLPLFNFKYDDGTPMVTVGGLLADDRTLGKIGGISEGERLIGLGIEGKPREIAVPHLTFREKAALDQLMPSENPMVPEDVERAVGFSLAEKYLEAYRQYYRHYPLFAEYEM